MCQEPFKDMHKQMIKAWISKSLEEEISLILIMVNN
jgi:hypothetical protein